MVAALLCLLWDHEWFDTVERHQDLTSPYGELLRWAWIERYCLRCRRGESLFNREISSYHPLDGQWGDEPPPPKPLEYHPIRKTF